MHQTATLFAARLRAFGNARRSGAGVFRPLILLGGFVLLVLVVVLGELAAASLAAAPSETATPNLSGRPPVVGDAAIEAAFWLDTLVAAFFAFRVMESLFRAPRVRALELLPVRPGPIFVERTANAALEGLALAVGVGLFFVPLVWHGHAMLAALCILMGVGATLCTACVTIGTNAWLGAQYGDAEGLGDAYGGQGGAFIYAPIVSFAMSIVCVLLLQLGAREVVHAGEVTNAFWLAVGLAIGGAAATLLVGGRHFVASYHRVAAFFREADEVGFRAVMDYQSSAWTPVRGERWVGGRAAALYRRHVLQFGRRYPVARTAAAIGAAAGVIACYALTPAAFPTWSAMVLPAALATVLIRPFSRIEDATLGGVSDDLLSLRRPTLERARRGWTAYETLRIAIPYGLLGAIARALSAGPMEGAGVAGAIVVVLAVVSVVHWARGAGVTHPGAANATAFGSVLAISALLAWNVAIGLGVVAAIAVAGELQFIVTKERK